MTAATTVVSASCALNAQPSSMSDTSKPMLVNWSVKLAKSGLCRLDGLGRAAVTEPHPDHGNDVRAFGEELRDAYRRLFILADLAYPQPDRPAADGGAVCRGLSRGKALELMHRPAPRCPSR